MSKYMEKDIAAIREWLAKEEYLPQDMDDMIIKKFLHCCSGSLERTKQRIQKFCISRSNMVEVYTNRDPTSKKLQTAFSITALTTYPFGNDEILIHQLDDPELENFDFYDVIKAFLIQADNWLSRIPNFPDGHICIMDIQHYYLKIVPKCNVFFFNKFLVFLVEAMPARLKEFHVLNCPTYFDHLYSLVKPVVPQKVRDLIHIHPNVQSLHKLIDKKYLPIELGGESSSMKEQQKCRVKDVLADRVIYLNENLWKADLKRKPKSTNIDLDEMNGSFRTLFID